MSDVVERLRADKKTWMRIADARAIQVATLRTALKKIADTPCPLYDEDAACELLATAVHDARAALSATSVTGQPEGTAQPEAQHGVAETGLRYPSRTGDGEADAPAICDECGKYPADPPSRLCPGCQAYRDHTAVY